MKCQQNFIAVFKPDLFAYTQQQIGFRRTASHYEICTALALSPVHNIRPFTIIQKNKVSFS